MFYRSFRKEIQLQKRAIIGGILLGIPNYFSIYFLMMAIRFSGFSDSVTYAINNTGVVMASFLVGILAFKEATTALKIIGGGIARSEERRVGKECRSRWSRRLYRQQE